MCGRLVKAGFRIHEGLDNNIHLYKWLQPEKDLVPPYSMFFLGCGGAIIDKNCLLLVQEKYIKSYLEVDLEKMSGGYREVFLIEDSQ